MTTDHLFVPTDGEGVQHHGRELVRWPLPEPVGGDGFSPGAPLSLKDAPELLLHDLGGLLGALGERIFLAETTGGKEARLVAETAWSTKAAAVFALDCVEHVIGDTAGLTLPRGASVPELLAEARSYLEEGEAEKRGLLQSMSRLALARRLRKQGEALADVAFEMAVEDEAADEDTLDDPAWTAVASLRDALLAAVEAIRHDAFPRLFEGQNVRYEDEQQEVAGPPEVIPLPWGNVMGARKAAAVPAWVAAQDAAERARQAVADAAGEEAGQAERRWQLERLAAALGPLPS